MDLEICVDSVESAVAAERGGAARVELCSDLLEGGVTPGAGMIETVRRHISIGLFVMIRPRGGDFCYTAMEVEVMRCEIEHARALGADGVVLGLLDEEGRVDVERTRQLVALAAPLPVTFHRAVDMTADVEGAVEAVIATGAKRILTSGGAANVAAGTAMIARMVKIARGRIGIMPGSGVTAETVSALARATGAREFHASLRGAVPSPVCFRKQGVRMGSVEGGEYTRYVVKEESVRELVRAMEAAAAE